MAEMIPDSVLVRLDRTFRDVERLITSDSNYALAREQLRAINVNLERISNILSLEMYNSLKGCAQRLLNLCNDGQAAEARDATTRNDQQAVDLEEPEGGTQQSEVGDPHTSTRPSQSSSFSAPRTNSDTHCYRMSDNVVDTGYPKPIQEDFPGLPDDPDASFFYPPTGRSYIFKGSEVWRLTNQTIDSGYPTSISTEFPGIPSDLSAAFVWHINGRIYFVKDTLYYRVTTPENGLDIESENPYPRIFSDWWRGLPNTIDAAFKWSDSRTYMFAGSQYYLLHPWLSEVSFSLPPYPRDTAVWWLDCDPDDGISDNGFSGAMSVATPSTVVVICVIFLNALWFLN